MTRTIWCFAKGVEGDWEAICVDFDIAVQGRSFDEVRALLDRSIKQYVESALKEEPSVRDQLLSRKAPLYVRAKLALGLLWKQIRNRSDGDASAAGFSMPCHV